MLSKEMGRSVAERTSAAKALFALCMRNTAVPKDEVSLVKAVYDTCKEWVEAKPSDIEALSQMVLAVDMTPSAFFFDLMPRLTAVASPAYASLEIYFQRLSSATNGSAEFRTMLTAERCQQLLPVISLMLTHTDRMMAAAAGHVVGKLVGYSIASLVPIVMVPAVLDPILAGIQCIWNPQKDVSWWKERCDTVHLDTMCLPSSLMIPFNLANRFSSVPASAEGQWEELIRLSVELAKVNQKAQLSAKAPMPTMVFYFAFRLIAKQASFEPKREGLIASGVVEALLYASDHDSPRVIGGLSTAAPAANAAVQLIGRNEADGGLTLSRGAVHAVLDAFGNFFDKSKRHFSALASRALAECWSITHMVVSDANKAFIMEHPTAIDSLVSGLLLEDDNPRRGQPGAAELQHACALALQNLALSDIGAGPLRARGRVMEALHKLAEGGTTDEARRCASGALFELETERRQTEQLSSLAADEHIMLSYNWDHQDVIKRVHASLVRRGYTTWIDVEKMQGSTVEAMAGAVEGAAVMCYGISRAYKESANCRLEAQYAHQREKDMVPLMVEEGYRADGWLGMLLGVRLYYAFLGSTLSSDAGFEGKMEELCRELGERGRQTQQQVGGLDREADGAAECQTHALRAAWPATLRLGGLQAAGLLEDVLERALRALQVRRPLHPAACCFDWDFPYGTSILVTNY
jgi:hypothetical protein